MKIGEGKSPSPFIYGMPTMPPQSYYLYRQNRTSPIARCTQQSYWDPGRGECERPDTRHRQSED